MVVSGPDLSEAFVTTSSRFAEMTHDKESLLATAHPSATRVGWVGTGVMGGPMCGHLLTAGYRVLVHSRTKARAQPLLDKGALWGESPRALAEQADVTFTMVGFPQDVRAVYFGRDGLLAGGRPGAIFVDMTTTEPSLAKELHASAQGRGLHAIDAPVSGGDVGAQNATLSIMVGGDQETVQAVMPLFELMGKKIVHQGGSGSGQHTKLCNQIVIAGTMVGVCESLLYGYKAGLDLSQMLQSIRGGAAACWTLDHLAPRMLQRNFDPGFFVEHFIKDMGIALKEAKRMGLVLPGLTLVHQLYLSVQAQGHGRLGTHALMLGLEALAHAQISSHPVN
jgi:3-hydroxyisobutyrate dehydrogenase